jgi:Bacterial capsule synthesis protein PGA_cap
VVVAGWYLQTGPESVPSPTAALSPSASPATEITPSPAPTEPRRPPPPRRFTIVATGDILIHSSVWERAREYGAASGETFDFRPMFRKVKGLLSGADLAICHLETPLSRDNAGLSSYPIFNVPHQIADAIAWAGYDECSTASNHSLDQGEHGVAATLDALDAAGIPHAGTARTKFEAQRTRILRVNRVRVAHLSYAYGFNGFQPPEDRPWVVNQIDPGRIVADARRARNRGAEFVVVSLHWGSQYVTAPTAYQVDVATRVMKSPAVDLILGHHAHVVQPIGRFGKRYVVYGLGNFLSNMTASCSGCTAAVQDGMIVHIAVRERGKRFVVDRIGYTPTWVEQGTTWRVLPVAATLDARGTPDGLRTLLEASWMRTIAAVTSLPPGPDHPRVKPKRVPAHPVG